MSENNVVITSIMMGDWSDDGHGKKDHYDLKFTRKKGKDLSLEDIVSNYEKNKQTLGYGFEDFWKNYDEPMPDNVIMDLKLKFGFILDSDEFFALEDERESGIDYGLIRDEEVCFIVAFLLYGLPDVTCEVLKKQYLFGSSNATLGSIQVGYGLYH